MVEPFYTVCRVLHAGGGWLAFLAGPLTLGAVKGSRRHILAGRCFVLGLGTGATAGVLPAAIRPDFVLELFLLGLMTLFFHWGRVPGASHRAGVSTRLSVGSGTHGGRPPRQSRLG